MPRRMVRPATLVVRDAAPARPVYDTEDIVRINAIIANSRPTWFALLGALVFCGITLLGVKDLDFFAANQKTQLPLVNVSVPVTYFFLAGSALVAAAYIYLHLYLELLWAALGSAAARYGLPPGDDPLSEHIQPWQVAEWGLRHRDWLRGRIAGAPLPDGQRSAPRRDLSVISSMMSIIFVWLFGPAVLFYFWWRSMPAHDGVLTTVTGLLFAFSCWIGWRSARRADQLLAGADLPRRGLTVPLLQSFDRRGAAAGTKAQTGDTDGSRVPAGGTPASPAGRGRIVRVAAIAVLVALVSLARTASPFCSVEQETKWGADGKATSLSRLCKGFAGLPDWVPGWVVAAADLAEARIVEQPKDWLSREEAERDFRAEWATREGLDHGEPFTPLDAIDWEAAFQRHLADRSQAGVPERSMDPGAMLLEGEAIDIRLAWAKSNGLVPRKPFPVRAARNVEAEFQKAWMQRRQAYLQSLIKPLLDSRNLTGADLGGAFLPGLQAREASLDRSNLAGANLEKADFSGARMQGVDLSGAILDGTNLSATNLNRATLSSWKFGRMNPSTGHFPMSGTTARLNNVDMSYSSLDGADFDSVWLDGSDLQAAFLENANFRAAFLDGVNLWGAEMDGSNWSISALRNLRLPDGGLYVEDQFERMIGLSDSFGDGSVGIPPGFKIPCQWSGEILDDEEFFGRWRGWVEMHDLNVHDGMNEKLGLYPAIPPPVGCTPGSQQAPTVSSGGTL